MNNVIAYNARTNGLSTIEDNKYQIFKKFVSKGIEIIDHEFYNQLL